MCYSLALAVRKVLCENTHMPHTQTPFFPKTLQRPPGREQGDRPSMVHADGTSPLTLLAVMSRQ